MSDTRSPSGMPSRSDRGTMQTFNRVAERHPEFRTALAAMADKIDHAAQAQRWVHSRDEDTGQEMIFRPGSFAFPPATGRRSFDPAPDGKPSLSGIGAGDRSARAAGEWKFDEVNQLLLKSSGEMTSALQVLRVEPDKLVVRRP